jgi:hypothetical protein
MASCEFADATYQPKIFVYALIIGACNFPIQAGITWNEMGASGADFSWRFWGCVPLLMSSIVYYILSILFRSERVLYKNICRDNYDSFRFVHIVSGSVAALWAKVSVEIHRSTYGFADPNKAHLRLGYSTGWKISRTCIDTNPGKTWMVRRISDHSIGCNNTMLGADIICLCWFANLLPVVFSMRPSQALLCNMLVFALVTIALIICDTEAAQMFAVLFIQLMSGLCGAMLAQICYRLEMQRYLDSKHTISLATKNRTMLYTFIPKCVISRLPNSTNGDMICANIPEAVIMFCSLEHQEALDAHFSHETFRYLHALFCKFDDAVQHFGMFKYQVPSHNRRRCHDGIFFNHSWSISFAKLFYSWYHR